MAIALTPDLGKFISELRYGEIPKDAVAPIHTGFTDCVGVMIAGANEPAPQLLKSILAPAGSEATLLFDSLLALDRLPQVRELPGLAAS